MGGHLDGRVYGAARVVSCPIDGAGQGHYVLAASTGSIGAGAGSNSELFHFRWTSTGVLCKILFVKLTGLRASTAFTAGDIDISLSIARSWTAAGTGGTFPTLTGNNQKLDTDFASTLMGGQRLATTAALGVGTKTLDAQPVGQILTHSSGGFSSATPIIGSIYLPTTELFRASISDGQAPITLANNEGVVIRATVPATGVWTLGFVIGWCETILED